MENENTEPKGKLFKEEKKSHPFDEAIQRHKAVGIDTYTIILENGLECLIKKPSMMLTAKIMPFMVTIDEQQTANYAKAAIMLINDCWIAGADEIRTNDEFKIEAGISALNLVEMKAATLKKN